MPWLAKRDRPSEVFIKFSNVFIYKKELKERWKYFLVCPIFTLPRVGSLLNNTWPWVNFGGEINFVNEHIYFQNYLHHPPPYGSWSSIVNFGSILKQKMKETEHFPKLSPDVTVGVSFMLHNPGPLDVTIQSISTLGVRTTIENG